MKQVGSDLSKVMEMLDPGPESPHPYLLLILLTHHSVSERGAGCRGSQQGLRMHTDLGSSLVCVLTSGEMLAKQFISLKK